MTSMLAVTTQDVVLYLHQGFSRVLLLYSALMAGYGLVLFLRGSNPSGGYLGALIIAEGVVIAQGIIGLLLRTQGTPPHDSLHYLYGVVAVLTLPSAYFLSSNGTERKDSLIFAAASLFLIGVAIRGVATGAS